MSCASPTIHSLQLPHGSEKEVSIHDLLELAYTETASTSSALTAIPAHADSRNRSSALMLGSKRRSARLNHEIDRPILMPTSASVSLRDSLISRRLFITINCHISKRIASAALLHRAVTFCLGEK